MKQMWRMTGLALLALLPSLFAAAAMAQAPYQPPRTPDGRPDLQGVWISRWITPLERQPGVMTLALSDPDAAVAEKAEWARHNSIDPIEGTENFEFTSFVVVRGEKRSSLIIDPADGRMPLVPEARAKLSARQPTGVDGPEARALNERCITSGNGLAPHVSAPSGNIRQIVQTRDHVLILTELISQLRIIPVNGRPSFGARNETQAGRWEGDALVIETTGFIDPVRGSRGSLFPVTRRTKIIERFRRSGPEEILYTFTVEDPALYTQAWTGETVMRRSSEPMFEFACHEGNYGLYNILLGARVVEERAAKAKSGKAKQ